MLITVDTGGTKTLVADFDKSGRLGKSHKFATPKDRQEYLKELIGVIRANYSTELDGIVVAVPGIVKNNIATWCANLGWQNFDIANVLKKEFSCPILLENDANLAGLAETKMLSLTPETSLYVTISTGIGTGIIINEKIEPALSSSEGGHALVEYDGLVREWESFASGRAIYETYGKYGKDIHNSKIWERIADKISRGFLPIIPFLQPDVVIIGGSMGTHFERYSKELEKILKYRLPEHIICPDIIQAKHPEEAVIYGCYYYGIDKLAR
ncbi:ROK family protein [Candidatus Saccharibacteria bacterium]|nr:ROK family protein [Candidatus Saccharibacteria bacterium]